MIRHLCRTLVIWGCTLGVCFAGGSLFLSSCSTNSARREALERKEEAGSLNPEEQKELSKIRREGSGSDWVLSASSAAAAIAGAFFGIRRTTRDIRDTDSDNRDFTTAIVRNAHEKIDSLAKELAEIRAKTVVPTSEDPKQA